MPQRFLRPGLTTSKRFNRADWQAQSFYVRLLTLVDDFGRYDADSRLLRSHAFPLGDAKGKDLPLKTIETACRQLSEQHLITFYTDPEGKETLQVLRWQERPRANKSKYAQFDNKCLQMFADANKCSAPSSSSSPSSSPVHHRHSPNGSDEPTGPTTDAEWVESLGKSEAYRGLNVKREWAKMLEWCKLPQNRKKPPSRRRFINWLNKCEVPIRADVPARIDKAKTAVAPEFKEWAAKEYPKQEEAIKGYKVWADVPDWMRIEWKRAKVDPLWKQGQ